MKNAKGKASGKAGSNVKRQSTVVRGSSAVVHRPSPVTRRPSTVHRPPSSQDIRGGDPLLLPKRVSDTQVRLGVVMNPESANALGNVHGGVIMKLVDEAGGFAAMKHARRWTVTVAVDSMDFLSAVNVGDLVTFSASVNWVGRTSIEVGVRVEAEKVLTGEVTHTNSAYLVYVALDSQGRPTPVPPLILETADDRRRWDEGARRQAHRLTQSKRK